MYTYNKNDNSYTFSSDDLDLEKIIDIDNDYENEKDDINGTEDNVSREKPKKIEIINGGNDLNISPVSDYIEIEKPQNEKKENIIIPEDKN